MASTLLYFFAVTVPPAALGGLASGLALELAASCCDARAPAIPIRMVTMNPPGSSPGRISLPKAPAMSPTMIHEMMPIY